MAWFDIADGRLRFGGRLTRDPIREWLATDDGAASLREAVARTRFSVFGRTAAARRQISRDLWRAISMPTVRDAVAAECGRYLEAWTSLAYAPSLPRLSLAYRRLVVVPRVMIIWRIASRTMARVAGALEQAGVPESFRAFFARWVVIRMDDAVRRAAPSPLRPLHAEEGWACVGVDDDMLWVDASRSGPDWQGHVVMYEMPAPTLPRRERQELEARIAELLEALPNLSRPQRDRMVRTAMDEMASARA